MRGVGFLFILIFCLGCEKETHPKIEIYLLKHPVESTEGVLFRETNYYKLDSISNKLYDKSRVDTILNKIIYGGNFDVTAADLSDYPFIKDDEILGFNPDSDIFVFDTVVNKRINYLYPGNHKIQFAITVDKSPVLTGYFWTGMWSHLPSTYNFYTDAGNLYGIKERDTTETSYTLEFGNPAFLQNMDHKKRPAYNKKIIDAFKISGRLRKSK